MADPKLLTLTHAYLTQVDQSTNTSKHYFVAVVPRGANGYEVMTAWGRIGTIGGEKSLGLFKNSMLAQPAFDRAVRMKEKGGYIRTLTWPSPSGCPSWFFLGTSTAPAPAPSVIPPTVVAPVPAPRAVPSKLQEMDAARKREEELALKKHVRARWNF